MNATRAGAEINAGSDSVSRPFLPEQDPAFLRWQDDLYDRCRDLLLREGYNDPSAAMAAGEMRY